MTQPQQLGLLGCTSNGFIKFWENIYLGPSNYISCQVPLKHDECILKLIPVANQLFLFITNKALYKLTISNSLDCSLLEKPKSVLSRFNLFHTQRDDYEDFVTMFVNGKEAFVITQTSLQRWIIHKNATDRFVSEIMLTDLLFKSISRDLTGSFSNVFNLEIQIQDALYFK